MAAERQSGLSVSISAYIDIIDELQSAGILDASWDWEELLEDAILRLPYADEICINHQCWVLARFRTDDFALARRRCEGLKKKIAATIARTARHERISAIKHRMTHHV